MIATSTKVTRDPLFLDTGFIVALDAADDQHHRRAIDHWRRIQRTTRLLTTSYIVNEVVTFFNNRGRHAKGGGDWNTSDDKPLGRTGSRG